MSGIVHETILAHLPAKRKTTPSGWTSFNAPCCVHNGTNADKRARGGLIQNAEDGVSFHCFNCGYKASWQKGRKITIKMRKFLQWLNVSDDAINKLALAVLQFEESNALADMVRMPEFKVVELPEGAQSITKYTDFTDPHFIKVLEYMKSRQLFLEDYDFMWTPKIGYRDRLIIPFYYNNQLVGYTARKVTDGSPKYMSEQQPGYVFNMDQQDYRRLFAIVVEGPMDAIGVEGLALLGSEVKDQQHLVIKSLNKQVILVPDRDKAGLKLIDQAIEFGWSVSMPDWDEDINDVNDAIIRYGRIYTLHQIVTHAESTSLKIKLRSKKWFG